jgi:hypothetical protein
MHTTRGADRRQRTWLANSLDLAIVLALAIVAFIMRRTGLPDNGLWHDDAWVATGAIHGAPRQLFMVGSGHPGFTAVLMGVSRVTDGNSSAMAWPAFAAGVLGAPLLFVALRGFGYARSVAALCGAALLVSDVHILYSTRVKTYALDLLVVLGLAALLPRLVRQRWTWTIAMLWVILAVVTAFFSGFALVATAIAGVVLVVYAHMDRLIRLAAVGMQAVVQLALYLELRRSSDLARIEEQQESLYDGHLTFSWNPIEFGGEVLKHFRRVVDVYPGGPEWLLTTLVLVVTVGLTIAAVRRRGDEAIRAQFLALVIVFAIGAATIDRFPFGPTSTGLAFHSRGERSTLWLVPALALGLTASLQQVRRWTGSRPLLRTGFDLVVGVLAVLTLIAAIDERASPYAFSGSKDATHFIERELRTDDVVVLPTASIYSYAVESNSEVSLRATPDRAVGYSPVFADDRILPVGMFGFVEPGDVGGVVAHADRVIVYYGTARLGTDTERLNAAFRASSLELQETRTVARRTIEVWQPANRDD